MTKVRPAATANTVDLYWDSVQTPEKTPTQEQGRTSVSKPSPEEQRKEWIANMRKPLTTPRVPKWTSVLMGPKYKVSLKTPPSPQNKMSPTRTTPQPAKSERR